jgi:hypothetical protein
LSEERFDIRGEPVVSPARDGLLTPPELLFGFRALEPRGISLLTV